jgi:GNAT superfamily N-acetyltransferase
MIKISPLLAIDHAQIRALLRHKSEPQPAEAACLEQSLIFSGASFWQHWIPVSWHMAGSVYVAKEDGVVLGLISVKSISKSKNCFEIDHVIVHPHHRGRGIAQELMRFVFALLGSQGVNHFISEVSELNDAALSLFNSFGFCRLTRVNYFGLPDIEAGQEFPKVTGFKQAGRNDSHDIFMLYQESLPPEIRHVFNFGPEDFNIFELPVARVERVRKRLASTKVFYWLYRDPERNSACALLKVTSHNDLDYHAEFVVHPGWTHLAEPIVDYALRKFARLSKDSVMHIKVYDFQKPILQALIDKGFKRGNTFCLLAKEHWIRAKVPPQHAIERSLNLGQIAKPAINLPRKSESGV